MISFSWVSHGAEVALSTRPLNAIISLESTPLQIKTDSAVASADRINVQLYDAQEEYIAAFGFAFYTLIKYWVGNCQSGWAPLSTQPSDDEAKIWTFTKTSTAFIISCNGVEVLNYVFSDSSNSDCASKW